jgi:hypothetical protein
VADVWQFQLAGVEDLEDDDVVPIGQAAQSWLPVEGTLDLAGRVEQVADDDPDAGTPVGSPEGVDGSS